jgi:integrase
MHWGMGAGWLDRNPIQGFRVDQKRHTPNRPVLTGPQYDQLLAIADKVDPRFRLALILAHETGHRIGAIRLLRWNDIEWIQGWVRWCGENDKTGMDHRTPLTPAARTALLEAQQVSQAIGDQWIFPAPRQLGAPVSRFMTEKWWDRAEQLAKLDPEPGRGWHSLRRKFATELKGTPIKDLCALGGWKDPKTILEHYQRPDSATMRQALEHRRRLEA